MFIQEFVANKDEMNTKVQEYTLLNYKMEMVGQDFTVVKKRKIARSTTIILIILGIIFFPIGLVIVLIYYFTREMYEVRVEINPQRAGETVPIIPDTDMTPLSSLNNNQNNQTSNTANTNVNTEPVNAEPVNAEPVNAEPVNAEPVNAEPVNAEPVETEIVNTNPSSCSSCGAELNPEDKFCVECGTKVK